MANRLFFYIGAELHGDENLAPVDLSVEGAVDANVYATHAGFVAASTYFHSTLRPGGDWIYLVECSADNASKQLRPTNMQFRLFAPWMDTPKEGGWTPPGQGAWVAPAHLGRPVIANGNARAWELVCSCIKRNAFSEQTSYAITRTGRANAQVVKTGERYSVAPDIVNQSDCSGRVSKAELDELIDVLKTPLPFPLMSVSDCNTFHTTGYLWGKLALDRSWALESSGAVLIVDLDQHNDAGAMGKAVSSDRWGQPLLGNYANGAYVVMGIANSSMDSVIMYAAIRKSSAPIAVLQCRSVARGGEREVQTGLCPSLLKNGTPAELTAAVSKLWSDLETLLGTKFKHLYITVDRDSMFGSRTQWGDMDVTFESPQEIFKIGDAIVHSMAARGVRLAGLDITGLPDARNDQLGGTAKLLKKKDARTRRQVAIDLKAELQGYSDRFDEWTAPLYRIQASAASVDDSLELELSLRNTVLGRELSGLKLDSHGKATFIAEPLDTWQIKFAGHDMAWNTVRVGNGFALIGARYTYSLERVV